MRFVDKIVGICEEILKICNDRLFAGSGVSEIALVEKNQDAMVCVFLLMPILRTCSAIEFAS